MVLFTDIGKDIDDAVALTYAIIKGIPISDVITTCKDSHKAAIIAKNLIDSMSDKYPQAKQIRVTYGSNKPLREGLNHGVVYEGPYSQGYFKIDKFDPMNIKSNGTSVVISPLTDYLGLVQRGLVTDTIFMGLPKEEDGKLYPDMNSYNFKCDPYASTESFKYQESVTAPFTFIGKDCAYKVPFTKTDFNAIGDVQHTTAKFLHDHAVQTFEHFKESVPELYERAYKGTDNMSYCYDPLTMLCITNPEMFTFRNVGIHKIATDVDAVKAKDMILSTIINGLKYNG